MQAMLRVGRVAVVVVWVGLLLALARSQWPLQSADPAGLPIVAGAADAEDDWMGVYMHGQKVGYSHTRLTPADGGYRLEETSLLRLSVLEQVQTIRVAIDATTAGDFAVRAFTVKLDSGLGAFDVRGSVDGSALVLHMRTGGETTEQRIPLSEPIYLPSSARAHLRGELAPGRTVTLRVFDPSAMEHQPLAMQVVGRERIDLDTLSCNAW